WITHAKVGHRQTPYPFLLLHRRNTKKSTVPTDRAFFLARISVLFVVLQELLAFGHAGSILAIILL
ncbi:hypothetical protein, partial [Ferrovum myxofaciens]|uniref:hypothetical protein n=1 Tax=Ferrovum myxofaciens TaxID=416213 RepID=UPI001F2C6BEB